MEDGTEPPFDVDKQAAYLRRLLRKGGTLLFARTSCQCTHSSDASSSNRPLASPPANVVSIKPTASQHVSGRLLTGRGVAVGARFRHVARHFFDNSVGGATRDARTKQRWDHSKPWPRCAGNCVPAFCRADHGFWPTRSHAARARAASPTQTSKGEYSTSFRQTGELRKHLVYVSP
jgi:hypothetical protein